MKAFLTLIACLLFFSEVCSQVTDNYLFFVRGGSGVSTIYRRSLDGSELLPLTPNARGNWMPRVSPDQTKMVFLSNRTGNYRVYTMDIDGNNINPLTGDVSGGQGNNVYGGVCWTPEGKILYINGNVIYKVNADGSGVATPIATAPSGHWSNVRCSSTGKIAAQTQGSWGYTLSIYTMDADGGNMSLLVPDDPGGQSMGNFSADGTTLYYSHDLSGHEESSGLSYNLRIYAINLATKAKTEISVNKPDGYNDLEPCAVGSKVYFARQPAANGATAYELWRMNLDGSERERLTTGYFDAQPEMAKPAGFNLFFVRYENGNRNIYRASPTGTNLVRLTSYAGNNWVPRVNHTQTKLVFLSDRSGQYQVYTMNADGTNATPVTGGVSGGQGNNSYGGVCWTQDGKILYINGNMIFRMNPDGTNITSIATAPSGHWSNVRCSSTGKIAAQTQGGWGYTLSTYIMNADGSNMATLIPDDPGAQTMGNFSEDGTTLYYSYDLSGHEESSGLSYDHRIYSIRIDGTGKTEISLHKPNGYLDVDPCIIGSKIYFNVQPAVLPQTVYELWRMNLDGSQRERLTTGYRDYQPDGVTLTATSASREEKLQPGKFLLEQNFPNPFNPSTTIRYALARRDHVVLSVYSLLGQNVAELVNGEIDAGYHEVQFNASNLASGVYFYRIQAGSFVDTKKLLLIR